MRIFSKPKPRAASYVAVVQDNIGFETHSNPLPTIIRKDGEIKRVEVQKRFRVSGPGIMPRTTYIVIKKTSLVDTISKSAPPGIFFVERFVGEDASTGLPDKEKTYLSDSLTVESCRKILAGFCMCNPTSVKIIEP